MLILLVIYMEKKLKNEPMEKKISTYTKSHKKSHWKKMVKKGFKAMSPLFCYTYNEFKKKSGLDNKEASSIWMDFKLKQ